MQKVSKLFFNLVIIIFLIILFCIFLYSISHHNSYFNLTFSETLQIITSVLVGYYISYYLGGKLTGLGKQKEVILDTFNKLEKQSGKLKYYFLEIVDNKNKEAAYSIINLLDNMVGLSEILMKIQCIENTIFLNTVKDAKKKIEILWENITTEELTNLAYNTANIVLIKETIHSLKTDIYNCKISLFE